jgi:hypothetical protein
MGFLENDERRYEADVVDMQKRKDIEHRFLSTGEGEGGRGRVANRTMK